MARRGPGTFSHFLPSIVAKHQKSEGGPLGEKKSFLKKVPQCRKKQRGFCYFSTSFQSPRIKKIEGKDGNFFEKSHNAKKTERSTPLVSPGMVCYAEKHEKSFRFSSPGKMIQFGTIKFRRAFKNYFGDVMP